MNEQNPIQNIEQKTKEISQNRSDLKKKKEIKEKFENKKILDVLKILSPGTAIRTALNDILRTKMGALIAVEKEGLLNVIEGGFKINCKFTSQKLVELAKMDGAIILSEDLRKILYANILLTPDTKIQTKETGTRHKAAERTAKQIGTIVIAVSERKNKIMLYFKNENHFLEETSEILRRASETLQILEKQKDVFDDLFSHLNVLEITNLTTMDDVCNVLQTLEIIRRISENVKKDLVELGKGGIIVSMRLKELTKGLNKERESILKDYFNQKYSKIDEILRSMNFDFLIETSNVLRVLFGELHDNSISSKGTRILNKTNLLPKDIKILSKNFKTLDDIFNLDKESLKPLFKNEGFIDSLLDEIKKLKEKILMGKKI